MKCWAYHPKSCYFSGWTTISRELATRKLSTTSLQMSRFTQRIALSLQEFIYNSIDYLTSLAWQDGEAYAYLIKALAPEHSSETAFETKDNEERAKVVLAQAEKLDVKRYLSPKDITEGSPNLNLAFVAQIFQHRWEILFLCLKES